MNGGLITSSDKIRFLRSAFGDLSLARDGVNVAVKCPSCGKSSSKKKLSINIESWQYHCWVCGVKGRSIGKIIKDHISIDLAIQFNSKFNPESLSAETEQAEEEETVLPDGFTLLCDKIEKNVIDPDIRSCLNYCASRGISKPDLWKYGIGTCTQGRFRRRIIIPSFDFDGALNCYVSRSIDEGKSLKYLNSKIRKNSK